MEARGDIDHAERERQVTLGTPRRAAFATGCAVVALVPLATVQTRSSNDVVRHVTIVANEYAFTAPATVAAGPTAFHFVNHGKKLHEVQLFRFNLSVSAAAARRYLGTGQVPDSVADASGSVLVAAPGDSVREALLVNLERGERYALICQFRDAPGKPQHATLGMVGMIDVR